MAKVLIAYFSHAGQNYSHGSIRNLAVGNTEVVAKKIHALIDSDLFYIDTVRKYPDDHMEKIENAKKEYNENARPELTARVESMEAYDTVIVAYPNWWTTMPMAVFTFLESYDFSGKKIIPFCTSGGSGVGRSDTALHKDVSGDVKCAKGKQINRANEAEIRRWLDEVL